MPHIVVEYSQVFEDSLVSDLLQKLHESISDSGLYKASQIRTRAYGFSFYTNAGGTEPFIHIRLGIKSGRDEQNKVKLRDTVLAGIRLLKIPATVSVEIHDVDRNCYGKLDPE